MSVTSEVPASFRSSAIQPGAVGLIRDGIAETLSRRRLISYLVRADVKKKGADTLLGNVWWVVDPLLQMLVYVILVSVIGILTGILLYRFTALRAATETWVAAAASAPIVLAYPLFLVVFGRSMTTIVMIGFIAGLPPVILKTLEGLAGTRRVLVDVGRSLKLGPWQMFAKILLPAALPTVFVGLRLGLIFCLINIVGVEFLINYGGLGQVINDRAERYDLAGTYAAIGFVILTSVLFFVVTERIERWLRPQT